MQRSRLGRLTVESPKGEKGQTGDVDVRSADQRGGSCASGATFTNPEDGHMDIAVLGPGFVGETLGRALEAERPRRAERLRSRRRS
jgi:hypothetical protein